MSIMDFFRTQPQQAGQSQAPGESQQPNQNAQQGGMGDSSNQNSQMSADQNKPVDPLAAYGKLFEESKSAPEVPPSFKLDSELVGKTAASMNFLQGIPEEVMAAAQNGDSKAIMQMINISAQKAYQAALSHSSHLTDQFVTSRSKYDMEKNLAPRVKSELTQQALSAAPNYANPVVREKLNEEARRFQKAYPDASPQEIAQMAQQYIMDLANALNPTAGKASKQEAEGEMDWTKYLSQ